MAQLRDFVFEAPTLDAHIIVDLFIALRFQLPFAMEGKVVAIAGREATVVNQQVFAVLVRAENRRAVVDLRREF